MRSRVLLFGERSGRDVAVTVGAGGVSIGGLVLGVVEGGGWELLASVGIYTSVVSLVIGVLAVVGVGLAWYVAHERLGLLEPVLVFAAGVVPIAVWATVEAAPPDLSFVGWWLAGSTGGGVLTWGVGRGYELVAGADPETSFAVGLGVVAVVTVVGGGVAVCECLPQPEAGVEVSQSRAADGTRTVTTQVITMGSAGFVRVEGGSYTAATCDGTVVQDGTACRLSDVGATAVGTGLAPGETVTVTAGWDVGVENQLQQYIVR